MDSKMPMTPKGLKLMLAGFLVMLAGYILMMGGGVTDPEVFNYDMFDFRRLVVAPVVIVAGIVVIIVAIMRCPKSGSSQCGADSQSDRQESAGRSAASVDKASSARPSVFGKGNKVN